MMKVNYSPEFRENEEHCKGTNIRAAEEKAKGKGESRYHKYLFLITNLL